MDSVREFQSRMQSMMDAEGLPYGKRTMTWNSRLAQELGAWADDQPDGSAIHDVLFKAYFVDNRNIGDIDVLTELAAVAGLDSDRARQVLETREMAPRVDADWERARQLGLTGVPTYVHDDLCVVGCQPIEVLMRFVTHLRKLRDDP